MKTIKVCYTVHPFYCPVCYTLYFKEVDCNCQNPQSSSKSPKTFEPAIVTGDAPRGCGKMFKHHIWGDRFCGRFESLKHSEHYIYCEKCSQNPNNKSEDDNGT